MEARVWDPVWNGGGGKVRAVMSDAWHALRIGELIVVSGSVSSGADACPLPFRPPFPLPASSYPRRNRETSKLHARKAESSYLLDSRVATAPPFARNRCEISPIVSEIFPIL